MEAIRAGRLEGATDGRRLKGGGSLAFPANGGLEEAADSGVDFPVDGRLEGAADGGVAFLMDGGLEGAADSGGHYFGAADGVSGMWIGMDLGAGLGIQGGRFQHWPDRC